MLLIRKSSVFRHLLIGIQRRIEIDCKMNEDRPRIQHNFYCQNENKQKKFSKKILKQTKFVKKINYRIEYVNWNVTEKMLAIPLSHLSFIRGYTSCSLCSIKAGPSSNKPPKMYVVDEPTLQNAIDAAIGPRARAKAPSDR